VTLTFVSKVKLMFQGFLTSSPVDQCHRTWPCWWDNDVWRRACGRKHRNVLLKHVHL